MENLACSWSPNLIVELIKGIAWPLVVLLIGLSFRIRIFELVRSFFSKNTLAEITATVSGLSAKFTAEKQLTDVVETASDNTFNLPKNMSFESIREKHEKQKTEFSEQLYQGIINHVLSLNVSDKDKIEALSREVSIFQSVVNYLYVNKVLFRSQYNLFYKISNNGGRIHDDDALNHFNEVRVYNNSAFFGWDLNTYISYPVNAGLICKDDNGYKLTPFGRSYMVYMSDKPQLIEELIKL